MTNRSKYPGPGEVSARQAAGDEPQQWAGDQDPLVELAKIVGESTAQYRPDSRVESQVSDRPLFPVSEERGASAEQGSQDQSPVANDYSVGAVEAQEPASTQDSFAALDAVFAAPKPSASPEFVDPFADLSAAARPADALGDSVDYVSDLPPVPKAKAVPEAKLLPDSTSVGQAISGSEVSEEPEMDDILSRDLEESLVASLNQSQVEREPNSRPRAVSRATPTLDAVGVRDVRPEQTLRERLERRGDEAPRPVETSRAAEPAPAPAPAQSAATNEPKALNELSQSDYDSWRAERAAERATAAAASAKPVPPVPPVHAPEPKIEEPAIAPQLRGSLDDIAPVKPATPVKPEIAAAPAVAAAAVTSPVIEPVAFEPDMAAFALDTGAELAAERATAPEVSAEETVIPAKHLEDALLAEFSLDDDLHAPVAAEAAAPHVERDIASELEASVDDIFADEIAQEPVSAPGPELEANLAAELNEIERMSADFEQAAEENDPFVNDGEDAWQLDESVANDPSLDEMSWPAAAEKLAQTEAAHQEALNAAKKQGADVTPPPGGYDLDAVAQAMRKADPSLDGGVLPQAVPRVSAEPPVEEEVTGRSGLRKGLMAAASIVAIAVVGGAGFFMFDFGGTASDATPPPIIRADTSPMKETPSPSEQPTTDTAKVFSPQEAAQPVSGEKMVQREDAAVTPLPPAADETDTVRSNAFDINPTKKVRTVIVRPDGTIVQNNSTGSGTVSSSRPRVVTSATVRNSNPQTTGSTTPAVVTTPSNQWSPLPDETLNTTRQVTTASVTRETQNAFATAPTTTSSQNTRNALLGVSVVPQSKPSVPASVSPGSSVRSNTLAPLQSQAPARTSSAPLNLTGNQGARTAAVSSQPVASTPTPGQGVLGEIPSGTYIVQVASVRTVEDARGQIRSYNRRYPNLMALVTPVITRADLGDKGVFYRIQVPFDGPTSANTFCGEFKTAGGDCYVRRN
ncbi:SPOR domain-containing protein [Pseudovibrio japonicus]|nr:SPOR domain-containing protein [Pseudovibrio japonicus]